MKDIDTIDTNKNNEGRQNNATQIRRLSDYHPLNDIKNKQNEQKEEDMDRRRERGGRNNCLSIMNLFTNNELCRDEYIKQENKRLKIENKSLSCKINQVSGDLNELNKLDMEQLCELEEKLELSLRKVRMLRENYYSYFCIECEKKQSYILMNGCQCYSLCVECIKEKKRKFGLKCPTCYQSYT